MAKTKMTTKTHKMATQGTAAVAVTGRDKVFPPSTKKAPPTPAACLGRKPHGYTVPAKQNAPWVTPLKEELLPAGHTATAKRSLVYEDDKPSDSEDERRLSPVT